LRTKNVRSSSTIFFFKAGQGGARLMAKKNGRPRKYASNAARQRAYEMRRKKAGMVRFGFKRRWFRKAALNVGREQVPPVSITFHCTKCSGNYRVWQGVRFIRPCARCLHAWNALLASNKLEMSRGEFMVGAPHGVGLLVTQNFNGEYVEAEHQREKANSKRGPKNTDNFGGGWQELYDKENEKEFHKGPASSNNHRTRRG
jgi:hypothetical protein